MLTGFIGTDKVVRMTVLIVTGGVEGKIQRPLWRPGARLTKI